MTSISQWSLLLLLHIIFEVMKDNYGRLIIVGDLAGFEFSAERYAEGLGLEEAPNHHVSDGQRLKGSSPRLKPYSLMETERTQGTRRFLGVVDLRRVTLACLPGPF